MTVQDRAREITLPTSGAMLRIKHISPLLMDDFNASLPRPPEPPSQEVAYPGGVTKSEPNPSHPDHERALAEHDYRIGLKIIEFCIEFGADCEVDETQVKQLREWAARRNVTLPDDDKVLYVSRILAQSNRDLVAIRQGVLGLLQPTEEAVQKAADSFPGEVSGT